MEILPDPGQKSGCRAQMAGTKCEDCSVKAASFGWPSEGKKRWCGGCVNEAHAGAVSLLKPVNYKKCEVCTVKRANFGLPSGWSRRGRPSRFANVVPFPVPYGGSSM
jgi:hypothetical protein